MKNLLLILVMLIMGVTSAQECITDDCDIFEPEVSEFDFEDLNCGVDFEAVKTELEGIVDTFFTELETYNYYYGEAAYVTANPNTFPFNGIEGNDYDVEINIFPFTNGAGATVSGVGTTSITINVNENKWPEFSKDEYYNNGDLRALMSLKKKFLIYHELGHAVLGLDHPCNTEADIMNTSQCFRSNTSTHNLSFPDDFPVENITTFNNAVKRMFQGTQGGQVYN